MTILTTEPLRVVLIDDEAVARDRLRRLLSAESDIEIVDEAGDGESGAASVKFYRPQALFLDIRMPGVSGLEMLRSMPLDARPSVVVVTAYDDHAVEAFDLDVVDYVTKPFGSARLRRACDRLRSRSRQFAEGWIAAKDADDRLLLSPQAVILVTAEGNYVRLKTRGPRSPLVRCTLGAASRRLSKFGFVQISRSAIVNPAHVLSSRPIGRGDLELVLSSGETTSVSRTYRLAFDRKAMLF